MPRFKVYKNGKEYGRVSWSTRESFPFNCGYFLLGDLVIWRRNGESISKVARSKINTLIVKYYAPRIGTEGNRRMVFSANENTDLFYFGKQFRLFLGGSSRGNHGIYNNWLGSLTEDKALKIATRSTKGWELKPWR